MKPIRFPQVNAVWAKDQKEYQPLPAYTDERQTISLWQLTLWERIKVLWRGRLWLCQVNLGKPLQAQRMDIDNPFLLLPEQEAAIRSLSQ